VLRSEEITWDGVAIRKHAETYAEGRFCERFLRILEETVERQHGAAGVRSLLESTCAVPVTV
jgi:hypothetical protein